MSKNTAIDFTKILRSNGITSLNPGVYCGNNALQISIANIIKVSSPINGEHLADVIAATASDYENVITHSQKAFLTLRTIPAPKRGELIKHIGDELQKNKLILAELIVLETGKIMEEALGEVQEMIDYANFAVGQSRMLYGKTMHSERACHRMYEQWHSLGTVGIISAFNFPVAVWAWNAFIAVVAGDTCIWKPSPLTPLTAIAIHKICCETVNKFKFPEVFSLFITQEQQALDKLVQDKRIALLSFTGSVEVGNKIAVQVANRLGRCILELGGNNAAIVDDSANIDMAVEAILFSAIGTAGQRCTSLRRLFLHKNIYSDVLKKLLEQYSNIVIGSPFDKKSLMGPIINGQAVQRYLSLVDEIKDAGGEILFGGNIIDNDGYYVQPAIVQLDPFHSIVQRENFLPILFIHPFDTIEQAIALQNSVAHGLSSAVFSTNLSNVELFLSAMGSDCGIANVNTGTSGAEIGAAFGGEKNSGSGREAGSDAWQNYMRRQTNTINWGSNLIFAQGINFTNT